MRVLKNRYSASVKNCVLLTPLDTRPAPAFNHGGGFTVTPDQGAIREINYYCMIHHFSRCSHRKDFNSLPVSGKSASDKLANYDELLETMERHKELVAGCQVEVRVQAESIDEAVGVYMWLQVYNLLEFMRPVTFTISAVRVVDYIRQAKVLLAKAKVHLRCDLGLRFRQPEAEESLWRLEVPRGL